MKTPFLLVILFLLTIQVFAQNSKYNNADILNIRAGAGVNYAVVGQLSKNEKVTVISESNDWTQITTKNGLNGYVSTNFLSVSPTSNDTKGGKGTMLQAFVAGFLLSLIPFLVYNGETRKKDGRTSSGYRVTRKGWNFKMSNILLFCTAVGATGAIANKCSKKDAMPSISENSNPAETPKTEDKQVAQEPQTTSSKYQSYNYYGNNVTEYLETKADGSVFYSTSTRLNPIKMLVTSGNNSNEFILTFPSGASDNQQYKMTKSDGNIIITPPNGKVQIYTPIQVNANQAPKEKAIYKANKQRVHFYSDASYNTKREDKFIIAGQQITSLSKQGDFVYVTFTYNGVVTEGFMPISELEFVAEVE